MVVVVLTQIGAALTTWTAPGLARVSRNTAVERGAESFGCSEVGPVVVGPLSFGVVGCGVQLMGRLRSDSEEFCEALGDIGDEEDVFLSLLSWLLK